MVLYYAWNDDVCVRRIMKLVHPSHAEAGGRLLYAVHNDCRLSCPAYSDPLMFDMTERTDRDACSADTAH
jgi:hypothetical protein